MADETPITREQMWSTIKAILALVVITFILNIVTAYQVNDTTHAVNDAKRASIEAAAILTAAINRQPTPEQLEQQAHIQAAFVQIQANSVAVARIEERLCGGPCPDPPPTTTQPGG